MKHYSVIIVEDDPDTLEHITRVVNAIPNVNVVGTATDFASAKKVLSEQVADILLTDLGLPDGNGIDLIRSVYESSPDTLAMVLSAFGDEQNVIAAIMAGAKGYILKNDHSQEIAANLQQLINGGSPISASIARYLLVQLQGATQPGKSAKPTLLTHRETEILELIAMGYRNNEIADKLFISYHTVVNHVRNIYDKLAVSSRSQAIRKASQIGLLKLV